ncbi:MAG TPA: DUF5107 domain-containing protein [Candidatus Brachybacterium merdigallinarum]|nr:DUF5107 domain-containing protein [Candidatus Brachybacterium merdigallinarum]
MSAQQPFALPPVPTSLASRLADGEAVAWSEPVTFRTYAMGEPDPYPLFVNRRVYQGSSGRVYPIPFVDRVEDEAQEQPWRAIHLENEWIRLMVLPELGGRIHVGYDKVAEYDFFYRNNVIKPALVGLAGPWVSGGVEFNWPQHHRPATHLPVCTRIEEGEDGSVTVWCSDHDPFQRMRGTHGIRLHPDRAVVEVEVRLHNRTSLPQTFLWWANAAAAVDGDYQAFFPTDVHHVADHARRAITAYPEADRPYYGYDYAAHHASGGDRLDRYENIKVPTSYMVTSTQDAFFGGYDHDRRAGFVHVADRHVATGKKMWTWGNDEFGWAWDRQLTDEDGPYVELMAGVYTDNQPDFSWLEPGETKTFRQTWFPYQSIGTIHQATVEAAVHLEAVGRELEVGVAVTRRRPGTEILIEREGVRIHEERVDLAPGQPWTWRTELAEAVAPPEVTVSVVHRGETLVTWTPRPQTEVEEPDTARIPPLPKEVPGIDELVRIGVHLEQYRHPSREAAPYFEEALRRDSSHVPALQAFALQALRRGLDETAENLLRRALAAATRDNANPRSGELSYLHGLALLRTGAEGEAEEAFAKAAWDRRWSGPAEVERARIAARRGEHRNALEHALRARSATPDDSRAGILQALQLRALGREAEAKAVFEELRQSDPLDPVGTLLRDGVEALAPLDGRTLLDVAADLAQAGAADMALQVLETAGRRPVTRAGEARPLAHYHRALLLEQQGNATGAAEARRKAREAPRALCFPQGQADREALTAALWADATDTVATGLLAMLLFDAGRAEEALALWRRATAEEGADPVALRNAALATYQIEGDGPAALALYERAMAQRPDPRLVYEADQLRSRLGVSAQDRLRQLETLLDQVLQRDDATVEYGLLLVQVGRLDDAEQLVSTRRFSPWEGGEGRALELWDSLQLALSREREEAGDLPGALAAARRALEVPRSLGEARHPLSDTGRIHGRIAELLEASGDSDAAHREREQARKTSMVVPVLEDGSVDYFATSLPDLLLFPERT